MLVLARKEGEKLRFLTSDGEIEVTTQKINGKRVTVAIDAPREVKILRAELDAREPRGSELAAAGAAHE